MMRKLIKPLAVLAGVLLFVETARHVSWKDLAALFAQAGPALILALLVYPLFQVPFTIGLRWLFPARTREKMKLTDLFSIRMTGEALNGMTPFLDVGGEPIKAFLMRQREIAPLGEAVTAVCMSRIVYVVSEICFLLISFAALALTAPLAPLGWVILGGTLASAIYAALLVAAQIKGAVRLVPSLFAALKKKGLDIPHEEAAWTGVESDLAGFYRDRMPDFIRSVAWSTAGWFFQLFEVLVAFRVLGLDIGLVQALILQAVLETVKTASFFIPGNLGSQEWGLAFAAEEMGFTAAGGFALSLLKRLRQLVWFGIGMGLWAFPLYLRGEKR